MRQPYQNSKGRDRSPSGPHTFPNASAFSLIEVLLSLGILAVALLIIFGILTPFIERSGDVVESGNLHRIANRISAEMESLNFEALIRVLDQNTVLYSSRDGDRLMLATDPELESQLPETTRYYVIRLTRNETLSPVSRDGSAGYLCFQIHIERLLYTPEGAPIPNPLNPTQAVFNSALVRTDL